MDGLLQADSCLLCFSLIDATKEHPFCFECLEQDHEESGMMQPPPCVHCMKALTQLVPLPLFPLSGKQTAGGLIQLQAGLARKSSALCYVRCNVMRTKHIPPDIVAHRNRSVSHCAHWYCYLSDQPAQLIPPGNSEVMSGIISSLKNNASCPHIDWGEDTSCLLSVSTVSCFFLLPSY